MPALVTDTPNSAAASDEHDALATRHWAGLPQPLWWPGGLLGIVALLLTANLLVDARRIGAVNQFVTWAVAPARRLQLLAALLPVVIIVDHAVYLLSSRRKQFSEALAPGDEAARLADLYFGRLPLLARYLLPAFLAGLLCAAVIGALTMPSTFVPWLPTGDVRRGAALGFVGAYVYMLLQLTDRARQRDITTGVAVWAASMPVLGPLMGGVAALLVAAGAGPSSGGSFTRDAVFFVAGMLPQQFAGFVQSGVRRIFQQANAATVRALPLTLLRGIGPEVEARLREEGFFDVSALAYASPYALIRATTYAPKQIADWIDEALMIATVPTAWEGLERVGVTGAMDLAWYSVEPNRASIPALATEIKMAAPLLANIVDRLATDAQVADLQKLYWDDQGRPPVSSGPPALAPEAAPRVGDPPNISYLSRP